VQFSYSWRREFDRIAKSIGIDEATERSVERIRDYVTNKLEEAVAGRQIEDLDDLRLAIEIETDVRVKVLESTSDLEELLSSDRYEDTGLREKLRRSFVRGDDQGRWFNFDSADTEGETVDLVVVDARGTEAHARYFTLFHEFAHVLLDYRPEDRSKDMSQAAFAAGEWLMEDLAATMAFENPVLDTPDEPFEKWDRLTFETIDDFRDSYFPDMSLLSTAIFCVERFPRPCCLIRVAKKRTPKQSSKASKNAGPGVPGVGRPQPEKKLRIDMMVEPEDLPRSVSNPIELDWWDEVPEDSILRDAYRLEPKSPRYAEENQAGWKFRSPYSEDLEFRLKLPLKFEVNYFNPNLLALVHPGDDQSSESDEQEQTLF
jgi:hypothetical protein